MNFDLELREIPIRNECMEKQYNFKVFRNFPGKYYTRRITHIFDNYGGIVLPEYSEMSIEWHAFERFSCSSRMQENFQLGGEFRRSLHRSYFCV